MEPIHTCLFLPYIIPYICSHLQIMCLNKKEKVDGFLAVILHHINHGYHCDEYASSLLFLHQLGVYTTIIDWSFTVY